MAISRDLTKEQLYRQAKRLGIKGRSKMSKNQLKDSDGTPPLAGSAGFSATPRRFLSGRGRTP